MTKPPKAVAQAVAAWLEHADDNLDMARRALRKPPRVKSACGHAHLAVELALKGYLVLLGVSQPRYTHDLVALVEEAQELGKRELPVEDFRLMNRFGPPLRYPDKPAPSTENALAAARLAERLVGEIRALMSS